MTSERRFGITNQPSPTCPLIDDVIICGKNLIERISDADENEFKWFKDDCELIRNRVEEIRAWGKEWKDLAIDLHSEVDELNDRIRDLERENEELKYRCTN